MMPGWGQLACGHLHWMKTNMGHLTQMNGGKMVKTVVGDLD